MNKLHKILLINILTFLFALIISHTCLANSAEPPSILIIVPNAPDNLEISIGQENTYAKAKIKDKGVEKYYLFYSRDLKGLADYSLKIKTDNNMFEIPVKKPLKSYNTLFTLDIKNMTLTPSKLFSRSFILVSLRIILTLVIEAIIFYLMGFRHKKSWAAFIVLNIITQGALNAWLNGFSPVAGYMILSLVFGEFFVFIFEIIAFLIFVKEHSKLRKFLYVLSANILSLIAGGYIITILPV